MNRAERRRQKKRGKKSLPSQGAKPGRAGEALQQGIAFHEIGQFENALRCYATVLELKPDDTDALCNIGLVLLHKGQFDRAATFFKKASAIKPKLAQPHNHLGCCLVQQKRIEEAVSAFQKAIATDPGYLDAVNNLGNAYKKLKMIDKAIECYDKAIAINPHLVAAHVNLGNSLKDDGRLDAAIASFEKAIAIKPDYAEAHNNLGKTFQDLGQLDQAEAALEKARALDPDNIRIKYNLGIVHLAQGRIEEGWEAYELRLKFNTDEHGNFPYPRWQGEPLEDKSVLIYAEQGLGDEISFSLLFPRLAALAKHCVVLCEPRLETLFKRSFPAMEVIGVHKDEYADLSQRLPPIDFQVAAGSLAKFLMPRLDGLQPSLKTDPKRVAHWRQRLATVAKGPTVGISWSSDIGTTFRTMQHSRLEQWQSILKTPGVTFVNLFYGDATAEIQNARQAFNADIVDFGGSEIDIKNDLDDLFALMSALDMIITTPSTTATMSSNLGAKTIYFFTQKLVWRTLGSGNGIAWFMEAEPLFFAGVGDFAAAAEKAGKMVAELVKK